MIFNATRRFTGRSYVDVAEAALANLLQQLVGADRRALGLQRGGGWGTGIAGHLRRVVDESPGGAVGGEQGFDSRAQFRIAAAGRVEVGLELLRGAVLGRVEEDIEIIALLAVVGRIWRG